MIWTFDALTGDYSLPHCVLRQAGSKAVTLTTRGYTIPLTPDQLTEAAAIARRWVETGEWEPASTPDVSLSELRSLTGERAPAVTRHHALMTINNRTLFCSACEETWPCADLEQAQCGQCPGFPMPEDES